MNGIQKIIFSSILILGLVRTKEGFSQTNSSMLAQAGYSVIEDNFRAGRFESTLAGGALFSPLGSPKNRPTVDYALGSLQFGYMITEPVGTGLLRGNLELVPEGFGSRVFNGEGSYIAGSTLWFRYNFLQRNTRFIPYAQVGGGFVLTDINHKYVGENFNFNVDASVGVRYFFTRRLALSAEYRIQHISNANLGRNNIGINAHGPLLGLSCFF